MQREVGVSEAVLRGPGLVPVGVDERRLAYLVEARALIVSKLHIDASEIVTELFFRAPANDQRCHRGPAEQPRQRDLRP
jgi:hypothetical protein